MNILFMGSPDFCVEFLKKINDRHNVVGIITKSDSIRKGKRQSRKKNPEWYALSNNIILMRPEKLNKQFVTRVRNLKPDIILVVAYGKKLPPGILSIPGKGCINIHFSLLPEYRGPAPIHRVLLNGETETGVTSMFMAEDIDTGEVILQKKVSVESRDDYGSLLDKLVVEGCMLMAETLKLLESEKVMSVRQEASGAEKYAFCIKKEEKNIDWKDSAERIYNKIRAFSCGGAWMEVMMRDGKKKVLKIFSAELPVNSNEYRENINPGQVLEMNRDGWVVVKCGKDCLRILTVQAESKSWCSAYDYLLGARLKQGDSIIYGK